MKTKALFNPIKGRGRGKPGERGGALFRFRDILMLRDAECAL
jgi:hypothetical protein